ncbi:MAG TPA: FkbM family methyltransferase [Gemmatimonadaceae bacterium]|nr:FkbM family methyltransferase [Gemmatimonadaceae bacterium]
MSRARYLAWRALKVPSAPVFRLSAGERLAVRRRPAADLDTAYEIFVSEVYRSPRPIARESVRRVVDLGANVGYSCTYFLRAFPNARVVAFEPHPEHVRLLRANLSRNGALDRVTVHATAAGTRDEDAFLSDAETVSSIGAGGGTGQLPVRVEDFFAAVGPEPIDLLKMDIEGGEYDLLADARFDALPVRALVLEWHKTPLHADAPRWCERRLAEAGFDCVPIEDAARTENGFIWAYRDGDR